MKTLNALHNPDMIAGGSDDNVHDLGDAIVNQSIGSQWKCKGVGEGGDKMKGSRVENMDLEAEKALKEFGPKAKINLN